MSLDTYATRLWVQPLRARRRRARSISTPSRTASNRSRPCGGPQELVRLVPHFTTRKVRCVTPAPSSIRVLSSSIGSVPRWSNNRTPSPSRTGTRSTCISSRSPALMHCCTRLAPITPTSFSPATAFACSMALSRPSVTNVNGDPSETHSCRTAWVTTKTGTSKGCLPPHPLVSSNVLRPVTNAPVVLRVSRRSSALSGETLNTISVLGSLYSVSPPKYHAKSRSPPSPRGASGPNDGPEAPLGDGGERLLAWYFGGDTEYRLPSTEMVFKVSPLSAELLRETRRTTGALVTGRRTFELTNGWGGRHPLDVPVFVVTHAVLQEWVSEGSPFTFVTDGLESAIEQAKAVAGEKDVGAIGASLVQQCIRAGLLDEIHVDLVPVLLGDGVRLFDHLGTDPIELESTRMLEGAGVTHLTFRVVK